MKRTAKSVITVAAIAAVLTLISCGKKSAANTEDNKEVETLYAVSTYKTVAGNLDDYLEFGGDVASVNEVMVLPDQAGKITNILVKVGDMVKKDQVIAYVNPLRVGVVYNDSPVKAPIAGRITSLPVTVGSTVSQSSSVAKVARTDDLEIRINIAERFISRISNGQKATVTFDAYPSVEFGAKIFEVSPVLDTSTRTMGVKLRLNPPDPRVKVGMYGRVRLVTDSVKNAIVLPSSALVTRDGKNYVFVISSPKSGKNAAVVSLVPVTKGIAVDNKVEITKGLEVGDEVVIKGQTLLNDGSKVNIASSN
ncbi:MAG: efflux RND transporter periplasmic adaptor subunit [Treponema sp.]|uniref:efflux RND transporter periplasmic adaptor subunit n=1 Tax=Treponema sp. TaxID=166 RepID=UPI0025E75DEA|nr:efflux RND transporter periplasmic adaptor subunit [Treponema sp.]MBQ8678277.1 efflux RND transporter periplasmic adaptor subunit [Treponema sp.]